MLHGLGGSHLNWVRIAPELATHHRVYAVDMAGFGLTRGTARSATVQANAEMVADFVREVVGSPAVLVGNSMGGMVSLLLTAAHPDLVEGLALVDPSIPVPRQRPDLQVAAQFALYATPFVGERYLEADPTAQRPAARPQRGRPLLRRPEQGRSGGDRRRCRPGRAPSGPSRPEAAFLGAARR